MSQESCPNEFRENKTPTNIVINFVIRNGAQRTRLGDVAVFENRQPVTAVKFITKSSVFILLFGVIRRLELKPISEQKVGYMSSPRHIAKPPVVCRNYSSMNSVPNTRETSYFFVIADLPKNKVMSLTPVSTELRVENCAKLPTSLSCSNFLFVAKSPNSCLSLSKYFVAAALSLN